MQELGMTPTLSQDTTNDNLQVNRGIDHVAKSTEELVFDEGDIKDEDKEKTVIDDCVMDNVMDIEDEFVDDIDTNKDNILDESSATVLILDSISEHEDDNDDETETIEQDDNDITKSIKNTAEEEIVATVDSSPDDDKNEDEEDEEEDEEEEKDSFAITESEPEPEIKTNPVKRQEEPEEPEEEEEEFLTEEQKRVRARQRLDKRLARRPIKRQSVKKERTASMCPNGTVARMMEQFGEKWLLEEGTSDEDE
jgi:hypothetical protein